MPPSMERVIALVILLVIVVAGALMAYKWFALRVWIAQERERSKLKDEEKLREKW